MLHKVHLWSVPKRGPQCGAAYDPRSDDWKMVTSDEVRVQCRRCWKWVVYRERFLGCRVAQRLRERFAMILGSDTP